MHIFGVPVFENCKRLVLATLLLLAFAYTYKNGRPTATKTNRAIMIFHMVAYLLPYALLEIFTKRHKFILVSP